MPYSPTLIHKKQKKATRTITVFAAIIMNSILYESTFLLRWSHVRELYAYAKIAYYNNLHQEISVSRHLLMSKHE